MSVPSLGFLAFALCGAALFNLSARAAWRACSLLAINLAMLASFASDPRSLLPLGGFVALGYIGVIGKRKNLCPAWLFPTAIVIAFIWLKRYAFVPHDLLLPPGAVLIGLSYIFFRVMHVAVDGWQDVPLGPAGLLSYLNYTLNFTCLVSGPIQRYEQYRACEHHPAAFSPRRAGRAIERIVSGFFKVYIVSSVLGAFQAGQIAAIVPGQSVAMRLQECCLGVGLYPLFLYANFSGYTDFVIGIAALFRITLPENFNHPFAATNFIDFWNRWHITLSQWLKSYVYTPVLLAAMRRVRARAWRPWLGIAAYFCTFFLVGIWHGQSSEFLFFGVLQGAGVAINKLYQTLPLHRIPACRRVMRQAAYTAFCRGLTFTWFTFTLLWFWSSWAQLRAIGWPLILASMLILLPAATLALTAMYQTPWPHRALSRYARTARATALAVVILATNLVLSAPAPQIVYKAF